MEPIKINIEVSLSEATIAALKGILGAQIIQTPAQVEEPTPQPKQRKAKAEKPAPAPSPVEDDDDLPADDAPDPAPKSIPTEADMRAAIKKTIDRKVSPKTVRTYIQTTFGIDSSVDCPEERRQELIDGLARLTA